jgi:hypothetical protein
MIEGQIVNHKRYGEAEVLKIYMWNGRIKGVLLDLLTEEGKTAFYTDRKGKLKRCYEHNLGMIQKSS